MTLLANGSLKDGSSQFYSYKLQRMTRPHNYYGPLLQTNYEKTTAKILPNSKINTSQSEKIPI